MSYKNYISSLSSGAQGYPQAAAPPVNITPTFNDPIQPTMVNNPMMATSVVPDVPIVPPWQNANIISPGAFPPYFRPTTKVFPSSRPVHEQANVPLGIIVNPTLVTEVPLLDCRSEDLQRCSKCWSYLSPFSRLSNNAFICPFCGASTQIRSNALQSPIEERIELKCPVYDMLVPEIFNTRANTQPSFVFLVDLSGPSVGSGFAGQFLLSLKSSLQSIPDEVSVSLVTMGNCLSAYDLSNGKEYIIPDLNDVSPLPVLFSIGENNCREHFNNLLDQLISKIQDPSFYNTAATGNCFGAAIRCCGMILAETGGVIMSGIHGFPTVGPHTLVSRKNISEPDSLKTPLQGNLPQGLKDATFYKEISHGLNNLNISVHLFAVGDCDLAVTAIMAGLTGGNCHYYKEWNPETALLFHGQLFETITAQYYWYCSLRMRVSDGFEIDRIYGNFIPIDKLVANVPVLQNQNAICFELNLSAKNQTMTHGLFQLAMLWTNNQRQRLIRIFNFQIPCTPNPTLVKQGIDEGALMTYLSKVSCSILLTKGSQIAQSTLLTKITSMISSGCKFGSILHLVHGLLTSNLLRSGIDADSRISAVIQARCLPINEMLLLAYPKLFAIGYDQSGHLIKYGPLALSNESFGSGFCFLFHCLTRIYIWVSSNASEHFCQTTFGSADPRTVPTTFPQLETQENGFIHQVISECFQYSGKYLTIEVVPFESKRQSVFSEILMDEAVLSGSNFRTFSAQFLNR